MAEGAGDFARLSCRPEPRRLRPGVSLHPFPGDRPGQAVVGREQRTAPADGQCVEDAQFAQRTPVVPGVGEEFRSPRGFRRAAFGADDEGFAQCCAGRRIRCSNRGRRVRIGLRRKIASVPGGRWLPNGWKRLSSNARAGPGRSRPGWCVRVSSKGIDLRPCASLRGIRPAREPVPAGA